MNVMPWNAFGGVIGPFVPAKLVVVGATHPQVAGATGAGGSAIGWDAPS